MAASYPGGSNTFVPSLDASGELVVNYSRNPKTFALNKYITLTPTKKMVGLYLRMTVEECARVLSSDLRDYEWPDGNDSPQNTIGTESFEYEYFRTKRYQYGFRLGYLAVEQADWKILATNAAIKAQQAMTARTLLAVTTITDTSQYDSTHVKTASQWGGGYLDAGTAANPILKRAMLAMARKIHKDTFGVIQPKDLHFVISPDLARAIGVSAEISDFLKSSPFALAQVRGDSPSQNGIWGMPDMYAGFKIVIEDAAYNPGQRGSNSQTPTDIWPYSTMACLARPGGLTSSEGNMSFSTAHLFVKEEMTVESKDDPDERRHKARVVDNVGIVIVSPVSGCLCTSTLSGAPTWMFGDDGDEFSPQATQEGIADAARRGGVVLPAPAMRKVPRPPRKQPHNPLADKSDDA